MFVKMYTIKTLVLEHKTQWFLIQGHSINHNLSGTYNYVCRLHICTVFLLNVSVYIYIYIYIYIFIYTHIIYLQHMYLHLALLQSWPSTYCAFNLLSQRLWFKSFIKPHSMNTNNTFLYMEPETNCIPCARGRQRHWDLGTFLSDK